MLIIRKLLRNQPLIRFHECLCAWQRSDDYQRLQDSCSQFEASVLQLKRRRKEAEYTVLFWKNFPGKMTVNSKNVCLSTRRDLEASHDGVSDH